ncbi:MAG: cupin domain-containing protein [Steroidobacteraceae bacterium]
MTSKRAGSALRALPLLLVATGGCNANRVQNWVPVYDEPRHRLAFENDEVMILDVDLPPGYVSLYHKHELDLLYVTISGSRVWAQPLGAERREADVPTGDLRFSSDNHPLPHIHRVGNIGTTPFHVIGVGIKRASTRQTNALSGDLSGMHKSTEKPGAVVFSMQLGPGERTGEHRHDSSFATVFLTAGKLAAPDGSIVDVSAADYRWQPAGTVHRYENAGTGPVQIVEVVTR